MSSMNPNAEWRGVYYWNGCGSGCHAGEARDLAQVATRSASLVPPLLSPYDVTVTASCDVQRSKRKARPRGRTSRANRHVVWADYAWNTTSSGESWAHVWPNRERLEPLANVTVGPPAASAWSWAKLVNWPPVLRI